MVALRLLHRSPFWLQPGGEGAGAVEALLAVSRGLVGIQGLAISDVYEHVDQCRCKSRLSAKALPHAVVALGRLACLWL
jgi:hypothetical protein